jgi:putative endopeptidase
MSRSVPEKPDIPPVQASVKPGNDFYKYVNGNWLRHASMPPFLSSYGVSEEIEDIINRELMEILNEARTEVRNKADKKIPHTTYLLGTLAESALNTPSQKNSIKFIQGLVASFQCIRDTRDVATVMADLLKHQVNTWLQILVVPQETNTDTLRLTLAPGELGLPDISYYLDRSVQNRRTITAYSNILKRLGSDFNVEGLERIIGFETIAAHEIGKSRRDEELLVDGSELQREYGYIPWDAFFESLLGWSPSEYKEKKILLISHGWLKFLNKCFRTFTLDSWKLIFSGSVLNYFLPILPPPYDDIHFSLYGKRLRGQTEKLPQKNLTLKLAQEWLTASLGHAFVQSSVPRGLKDKAEDLAREVKAVARERAGATDWLAPATRAKAARKVKSIYLGVAYPAILEKDQKTQLNPEILVKNVLDLAHLDFKDQIEKVNTQLQPERWDDAVFSVNAYYYNEGNRLILPAGILRWPFFHTAATDGWNFGGLGATIGHEICHAFDAEGKDFDETGNRNPWWSKQESNNYLKKTKALIKLYNDTTYFGHHLNGELTLSENIADLGGLGIALAALKKRLDKENIQGAQRKKQLQDFFISFAVSWRTKEKREKAMQSLFMDVHAPPSARVNNIVCQFDDWYECFDVKPGDILYKDPKQRIHIF